MSDSKSSHSEWDRFFERIDPVISKILGWDKWRFDEGIRRDIAQKIRAEAVEKQFDRKSEADLIPHLKRLTISRCIDQARVQIRDGKRYVSVEPDSHMLDKADERSLQADSPALLELERKEMRKLLLGLLAGMGPPCAELLDDLYFEGLKYKELADKNEVNINTIASRINRCMNKLKELLKNSSEFREELKSRHRKS